ncbi:hypothetical protein GCM10009563_03220 [Subtercola frigoramans]
MWSSSSVARQRIGLDPERAYLALGASALRVEILTFVLTNASSSTAEIMTQFAITRNGALDHLRLLQRNGLVSAERRTHPRGSGPITYWSAEEGDVAVVLYDLIDYILGLGAG